jgi:hypothetical protein
VGIPLAFFIFINIADLLYRFVLYFVLILLKQTPELFFLQKSLYRGIKKAFEVLLSIFDDSQKQRYSKN